MFMRPPMHPLGPPIMPSFSKDGPPPTPPPLMYTPTTSPRSVDPGSIKRCKYKYVYVWLTNGQEFWFYPTYVGRKSISGYRWIGFMWIYYGTDLDNISSFVCF